MAEQERSLYRPKFFPHPRIPDNGIEQCEDHRFLKFH